MDVLDAYNRIARNRRFKLPKIDRSGLVIETNRLSEPADVWPALAAHAPTQGWLQSQSAQMAFDDGLPEPATEWGLLLAAEAVISYDLSISLSLDGAGGWTLISYRKEAAGDLLHDVVTQPAYDRRNGVLRYRRWWRRDDQQGYLQVAACFIGYE